MKKVKGGLEGKNAESASQDKRNKESSKANTLCTEQQRNISLRHNYKALLIQ